MWPWELRPWESRVWSSSPGAWPEEGPISFSLPATGRSSVSENVFWHFRRGFFSLWKAFHFRFCLLRPSLNGNCISSLCSSCTLFPLPLPAWVLEESETWAVVNQREVSGRALPPRSLFLQVSAGGDAAIPSSMIRECAPLLPAPQRSVVSTCGQSWVKLLMYSALSVSFAQLLSIGYQPFSTQFSPSRTPEQWLSNAHQCAA